MKQQDLVVSFGNVTACKEEDDDERACCTVISSYAMPNIKSTQASQPSQATRPVACLVLMCVRTKVIITQVLEKRPNQCRSGT